ncbi:MAG TPA: peptidylprolyl isomerase [Opitutaceae bacterium]|nr:peptidylprolyl isomerase [Opitutaceae bacterium]
MRPRCRILALVPLLAAGSGAFAQPSLTQNPIRQQTTASANGPSIQLNDDMGLRFADGIVAIAEDKVITVDDVRREISPYLQQLQREARSQEDFNQKLESLQDSIIQQLIDRVLIIKEFHKHKEGEHDRQIPADFVDNQISERLSDEFDNDRSKFLAYLRQKGETMQDYRKEVEEDIIYNYMRQQQHKSESFVSPVRIEQFYKENKDQFYQEDQVHLRMIELTRSNNDTDEQLRTRAAAIMARLRSGEKFEDLAKQFSEDARRSKGGDWNWVKRSDLKPEFSEPLFALKKGQVTEPIINSDGCFILYVEDRKYAGIQPLNEVRPQIEAMLNTQMTNAAEEKWLERLRRDGYVKHF